MNYAVDHMGKLLVPIFQSLVYKMLNWFDINGTLDEMNSFHKQVIYHLMVVPIFECNFDTIPIFGNKENKKKNHLNFNLKHLLKIVGVILIKLYSFRNFGLCLKTLPTKFLFSITRYSSYQFRMFVCTKSFPVQQMVCYIFVRFDFDR